MKIKFMWNGIKIDGKLYRAWYSDADLIGDRYPKGTLTIYRKDYGTMPQINGMTIQNDTEIMTDYFERDRIRITPDNPHYSAIKAAMDQQKEHNKKRHDAYQREKQK